MSKEKINFKYDVAIGPSLSKVGSILASDNISVKDALVATIDGLYQLVKAGSKNRENPAEIINLFGKGGSQ